MVNWEVVLWTCITIAVLAGIGALILIFIYTKNLKKRTSELKDLHIELKTGMNVMFGAGIYGKVVSAGKETIEVEVAKNVIITVSRYSIQSTL